MCCWKKKTVHATLPTATNTANPVAGIITGTLAAVPEVKTNTFETANIRKTIDAKAGAIKGENEKKVEKPEMKKDEQKCDDQTQIEGSVESDKEKADIIPMTKVKVMGNIDEVCKKMKAEMEKAAEEIKSIHEMDNEKPLNAVFHSNLHVKIDENKCKLYETNDEPTIDDEVDDPII
uniref:Uncharacterized protein n=1 Tax=Setaria digitata TaxID=48799 RepID=A0A915PS13_9BILA